MAQEVPNKIAQEQVKKAAEVPVDMNVLTKSLVDLRSQSGLRVLQNDPRPATPRPTRPGRPPDHPLTRFFRLDALSPSADPNTPRPAAPDLNSKNIRELVEQLRKEARTAGANWDQQLTATTLEYYLARERLPANTPNRNQIEVGTNMHMTRLLTNMYGANEFISTFDQYVRFLNEHSGAQRHRNAAMENRLMGDARTMTAIMPYWGRVMQVHFLSILRSRTPEQEAQLKQARVDLEIARKSARAAGVDVPADDVSNYSPAALLQTISPVEGRLRDIIFTQSEEVAPPRHAQSTIERLAATVTNEEQQKGLREALAGVGLTESRVDPIRARRVHALYINLLADHRRAESDEIIRKAGTGTIPPEAIAGLFQNHQQIGQLIMQEHLYGFQTTTAHMFAGTLGVSGSLQQDPNRRGEVFTPGQVGAFQDFLNLMEMTPGTPAMQESMQEQRNKSATAVRSYITYMRQEALQLRISLRAVDTVYIQPAVHDITNGIRTIAEFIEGGAAMFANWAVWGPLLAYYVPSLREWPFNTDPTRAREEATRRLQVALKEAQGDLARVQSLHKTIVEAQQFLEKSQKDIEPHLRIIEAMDAQAMLDQKRVKEARAAVEAIAKIEEGVSKTITDTWTRIEVNMKYHAETTAVMGGVQNSIARTSMYAGIAIATVVGNIAYNRYMSGSLAGRFGLNALNFTGRTMLSAAMPLYPAGEMAWRFQRWMRGPAGPGSTPAQIATQTMDTIVEDMLAVQSGGRVGLLSRLNALEAEVGQLAAGAEKTALTNQLTLHRRDLVAGVISELSAPPANLRMSPNAWRPVFDRIAHLEEIVEGIADGALKTQLKNGIAVTRRSMLRNIPGLDLNRSIPAARWVIICREIRTMLGNRAITGTMTPQALQQLRGVIGTPTQTTPSLTVGQLLDHLHELNCQNRNTLSGGLLRILTEAEVEVSTRGLLVDLGVVGTRVQAPPVVGNAAPRLTAAQIPEWYSLLPAGLRDAIRNLGPAGDDVILMLESSPGLRSHLFGLQGSALTETLAILQSNPRLGATFSTLTSSEVSNVLFAANRVIPSQRAAFLVAIANQAPELLRGFPPPSRWNQTLNFLRAGGSAAGRLAMSAGRVAVPVFAAIGLAYEAYTLYNDVQEVNRVAGLRKQLDQDIETLFSVSNGFDLAEGNEAERKAGGGVKVFVQRATGLRFDVTQIIRISDEVLSAATAQGWVTGTGTAITVLALVGGVVGGSTLVATGLLAAVAAPIAIVVRGELNERNAAALRQFILTLDPRLLNFFRLTNHTLPGGRVSLPGVTGRNTADLMTFIIENRGSSSVNTPDEMVRALNKIAGSAVYARMRELWARDLNILSFTNNMDQPVDAASYVLNTVNARVTLGVGGRHAPGFMHHNNESAFNWDNRGNWSLNIPLNLDERIEKAAAQKLNELTGIALTHRLDRLRRHERAAAHFAGAPLPEGAAPVPPAPERTDLLAELPLYQLRMELNVLLGRQSPPPVFRQLLTPQLLDGGRRSDVLRSILFPNTPTPPLVYRCGDFPQDPVGEVRDVLDQVVGSFQENNLVLNHDRLAGGNYPRAVQLRHMKNGLYEGILVTVLLSPSSPPNANDQVQFFAWRRTGPQLRGLPPEPFTLEGPGSQFARSVVSSAQNVGIENLAQVQEAIRFHAEANTKVRQEEVKKKLAGNDANPEVQANNVAAGSFYNAMMAPDGVTTVTRTDPQGNTVEFAVRQGLTGMLVSFRGGRLEVRTLDGERGGAYNEIILNIITRQGGALGELGPQLQKQAVEMYGQVSGRQPESDLGILASISSPIPPGQLAEGLLATFPNIQGPVRKALLQEVMGSLMARRNILFQQRFLANAGTILALQPPQSEVEVSHAVHAIEDAARFGTVSQQLPIPGLPPNPGQ